MAQVVGEFFRENVLLRPVFSPQALGSSQVPPHRRLVPSLPAPARRRNGLRRRTGLRGGRTTRTARTAAAAPTATATPTPTFTSNISGYSLSNITISAGTVIKWINSHSAPHTVTSGTPGNLSDIWDSGTISNGNSYSYEFSNSGTFQYFCKIHTSMRATVTVN